MILRGRRLFPWSEIIIGLKYLKRIKGLLRNSTIIVAFLLSPLLVLLLKNRITPTLEQTMSKFQNGGMRGKGVVDNLFLLRGLLDHAKYLGKEVWVTFYDTEKCFDSL